MTSAHIQWYPGHMHKASKEIRAIRSKVQVFIELLDARIPYSSANPMLDSLRGDKPVVRVFAKSDLADPGLTARWEQYFREQGDVAALFVDSRKRGAVSRIIAACRNLSSRDAGPGKSVTAMVAGIPNVGKSTLINTLAGRAVAKTGNEPAITRGQQYVDIEPGFVLLDTPGVMWPNVENSNSGYRLAITGAIRDTALPHTEVGLFAVGFLASIYPEQFSERFRIDDLSASPEELLVEVGRRRGCLVKGGNVDLERTAKILIADIREGRLGRITLETPEISVSEIELVQQRKLKKQTETEGNLLVSK